MVPAFRVYVKTTDPILRGVLARHVPEVEFLDKKPYKTKDLKIILGPEQSTVTHSKQSVLHLGRHVQLPLTRQALRQEILSFLKRNEDPIAIGAFLFDPLTRTLSIESVVYRLTEKESEVLHYLAMKAGFPVSGEELAEQIWHHQMDVNSHTVQTLVYKLRQKIEEEPESPKVLISTPDGYVLNR